MPEISRFFGIVVQMYVDDHLPPHFHALHAGNEAVIAIGTHQLLSGRLSPRALALVVEWAALHVDDLVADWRLAQAREPLLKIAPLVQDTLPMLRIRGAMPLQGRTLRLILTDGSVVERDITSVLHGPIFERLASDDAYFRRVRVRHGTVAWPGNEDIAPEMLIWGGPDPEDGDTRRPTESMRVQSTRR